MISRKFGFAATLLLIGFSCKSISQKEKKELSPIAQTVEIAPIALVDPKIAVIEPLSAGHFEAVRFAFYNLENLFDTIDGPNDDAEYLPQSSRQWNSKKYQNKLQNMASVIDSLQPHVLGVCEVENLRVLEDLKKHSSWLSLAYANIVHKE